MKARQRSNWTTLTGGWSQASRVLVVGFWEVIIVGAELCTVLVPLEDWILGWGSNRQGSSWRVVGCSQGGKCTRLYLVCLQYFVLLLSVCSFLPLSLYSFLFRSSCFPCCSFLLCFSAVNFFVSFSLLYCLGLLLDDCWCGGTTYSCFG